MVCAFVILIVVSAYTANLAAYLGAQPLSDFWATIEQANADGAKICAHSVLQGALPQPSAAEPHWRPESHRAR